MPSSNFGLPVIFEDPRRAGDWIAVLVGVEAKTTSGSVGSYEAFGVDISRLLDSTVEKVDVGEDIKGTSGERNGCRSCRCPGSGAERTGLRELQDVGCAVVRPCASQGHTLAPVKRRGEGEGEESSRGVYVARECKRGVCVRAEDDGYELRIVALVFNHQICQLTCGEGCCTCEWCRYRQEEHRDQSAVGT